MTENQNRDSQKSGTQDRASQERTPSGQKNTDQAAGPSGVQAAGTPAGQHAGHSGKGGTAVQHAAPGTTGRQAGDQTGQAADKQSCDSSMKNKDMEGQLKTDQPGQKKPQGHEAGSEDAKRGSDSDRTTTPTGANRGGR
jgi:hypothetical protein